MNIRTDRVAQSTGKVVACSVSMLGLLLSSCTGASSIEVGNEGYYTGRIVSGEAFGIRVGDTKAVAHKNIIDDAEFSGKDSCRPTVQKMMDCQSAIDADVFILSQSLRRGPILVRYERGKVVEIAWKLHFLPVIDL